MAKDLPYFKFYSSEWNDGDITLEDYHTQGVFINACSYYWSRECNLEKTKLYKRFRDCQGALDFLFESALIGESKGFIKIKFLDRQWKERENKKATMKANGLKGGRPKKNQKVSDEETKSFPENNQTITNKEEKREEEKRKELKSKPKKPKPGAFSKFFDLYPKPFSPICIYTKQNFYEQVARADGEDVILVAASMYADYCKSSQMQVQHIPKAQNWLNDQSWRTDWNDEKAKARANSKSLSTSGVSEIKEGDAF